MLVESPEQHVPTSSIARSRHRGRAVLLAGVAAACGLGVSLGLWAKPQMQERRAATVRPPAAAEAPPALSGKLQIVVDGRPAPPNPPSVVIPAIAGRPPAPVSPTPTPRIEPPAPVRPAEGLIRAQTVSPPAMPTEPDRLTRLQRARDQAARTEATRVRLAQARAAKAELAKAQLAKAQIAKAQVAKARAARIQLAKAEAAQVQAHTAAAHRLELAQLARAKAQAKAERAEQVRLAQAEAKGRAEARAEARQAALDDARKQARLAALAHALARAVHHAPPPVELAKLERRGHRVGEPTHAPRVVQASLKARRGREAPRLAAAHQVRAHPELLAPQPASGLVRVSTTPHCANRDPGEAVVCADPSLGAAERQLSRAYQVARAAGVPDAQLRSQQQRWLASRSAAAREAPWAVRDVYMARIAELNGQAKDAQSGY